MTHYPHCLHMNHLRIGVHLGFGEEERVNPQAIEVSIRLYMQQPPEGFADDNGSFICYGQLSELLTEVAHQKPYKLIEHITYCFYHAIAEKIEREYGASHGIKIWVHTHKLNPPVPMLMGGSAYTYTDIEPTDTVIPQ